MCAELRGQEERRRLQRAHEMYDCQPCFPLITHGVMKGFAKELTYPLHPLMSPSYSCLSGVLSHIVARGSSGALFACVHSQTLSTSDPNHRIFS